MLSYALEYVGITSGRRSYGWRLRKTICDDVSGPVMAFYSMKVGIGGEVELRELMVMDGM